MLPTETFSLGDNLHEMSKPVFLEKKKNITNLSSAELSTRVIKVYKPLYEPQRLRSAADPGSLVRVFCFYQFLQFSGLQ